jgi:hypothetical protein
MLTIHEHSDNAIHDAIGYFALWRESGNYLLLFDALAKLNEAESSWTAARGKSAPMRREWQELRRAVMCGLEELRTPLLDARKPADTERALYGGGKRATLARRDQLAVRAVAVALASSGSKAVDYDKALGTLADWGISRTKAYLVKRASELGLTRRPDKPTRRKLPAQTKRSSPAINAIQVSPGRLRHRGTRY